MASAFAVTRLETLKRADLQTLLTESKAAGFRFVGTLIDDYEAGTNRFDQPGEALFGIYDDGQLVVIGGLNLDPFHGDLTRGRVRRVYVAAALRRSGLGRALLAAIVGEAKRHFSCLALRTNTTEGAAFYESLGFRRLATDDQATHLLDW